MKKIVSAALILMLAASAVLLGGCKLFHKENAPQPTEIDIPTAEPTPVPTPADPADIDAFLGDWYGVYRVTEAAGFYVPNANTQNDCAMRVSLDEFGMGECYLAVNGLPRDVVSGSSNVFALCNADVREGALRLEGMINTLPIEWRFEKSENRIELRAIYGDEMNYMHIEIFLARPDALEAADLHVDAAYYIESKGFSGIMDKLGGSSADLPALTPPEGYEAHDFFTVSVVPTLAPEDGTFVTSADGHIRLNLPEGYVVTENDIIDFVISCPEEKITGVEFTVSAWNTDALSFLLGNTPNVTELYHYVIDGFDFYGTFVDAPEDMEDPASAFKLCGTNESGCLIIINLTMAMDSYSAYSYINVDNASFTKLILGARFFVD